ncbi:MAG TPA: RluA family pseudouridine synthase [Chlamydiales bacterium]|jgi:tRNA pseudouridine32 synthase/23S rRNA pseudouridine746 synthase/23S rRNA pseudouridine1911/1915/1917 synthase|nr:RluA family pseudouridine synthase [Chlamydiales bacterium]
MKYTLTSPMKALEALKKLYPDSSRRTLQNWLKAGRFTVDGRPILRENEEFQTGQVLFSKENCKPQLVPGLKVLYEDRYLVAVDKPEGLLSVPLDDGQSKHALGMLRDHYQTDQIYAVHRIDRETSGCLLFARGKEAEERLKDLFEKHDLKRIYFAIVEGRMLKKEGTRQSRLLELENLRVVESEEGRNAITHFTVLKHSPKYTYLKLMLETGRKHQIRVHCSAMGHPVLGDARYGSSEDPIRRMCLHARYLELVHPFTGKLLKIESPLPSAFKKLTTGL